MAAPNIRNPSSLIGKTSITANISVSLSPILLNGASSGDVYKINSIFAANRTGSNSTIVDIALNNGSTTAYLAYNINVPAEATQIISTKETYFYLEEGWSIQARAGSSNYIDVIISYEEISNS
jgi:hypothetical protein